MKCLSGNINLKTYKNIYFNVGVVFVFFFLYKKERGKVLLKDCLGKRVLQSETYSLHHMATVSLYLKDGSIFNAKK